MPARISRDLEPHPEPEPKGSGFRSRFSFQGYWEDGLRGNEAKGKVWTESR